MCPAKKTGDVRPGWLIAIGGAENKLKNPEILERFHQLCGGNNARIMVIPTASELEDAGDQYVQLFERMGGKAHATPLNDREDCYSEDVRASMEKTSGIFITGGNQLRLSTIIGGTPVAHGIRRLNATGTPVAGTSAGAAVISEHMIAGGRSRSTPREHGATMAPGLGLTNKVIIDQHFRQRNRIGRLLTALSYNPFASGLGIDENTAVFIDPEGVLEVVGSGAVTVVDPAELSHSSMHDAHHMDPITLIGLKVHILAAGARYDVNTRLATPPQANNGR